MSAECANAGVVVVARKPKRVVRRRRCRRTVRSTECAGRVGATERAGRVVRRRDTVHRLATEAEIDALFAFLRSVHAQPAVHERLTLTSLMVLVPRVVEFVEQLRLSSGEQKLDLAIALLEGALRRINVELAAQTAPGAAPIVFLTDDEVEMLKVAIHAIVAASKGEYRINERAAALVRWASALARDCQALLANWGVCGTAASN